MTDNQSLMQFPCDFPIKIVGKKTPLFAQEISQIIRAHFPSTLDERISCQESKQGNYLSITVTVHAQNQKSLDALYEELTKHTDIKMVL